MNSELRKILRHVFRIDQFRYLTAIYEASQLDPSCIIIVTIPLKPYNFPEKTANFKRYRV